MNGNPLNETIKGTLLSELASCTSSSNGNQFCMTMPHVPPISSSPRPYFIENLSLRRVFFVSEGTPDLISFIKKVYEMMEYEYEVIPLPFSESFTPPQWKDFYHHITTQYGKSFPLNPLFVDSLQEYAMAYLQQLRAKSTFCKLICSSACRTDAEAKKVNEAVMEGAKEEKNGKIVGAPEEIPKTTSTNGPIIGIHTKDQYYAQPKSLTCPTEFDSLYLPYYPLEQDWEKSRKESLKKIVLLMDKEQMITMVIHGEDCRQVSALIEQMDGYLLLGEYSQLGKPVEDTLTSFFHLRPFVDEQDARRKVESYEILLDIALKKKEENGALEDKIKDYLLANYEITGDTKKIMKACVLQKRIESTLLQKEIPDAPRFGRIVSTILLSLGLKKKRMSDGIYYYGIEPRNRREKEMTSDLRTMDDLLAELVAEREKL